MKRSPRSAHTKHPAKQKGGKAVLVPKRIYVRQRLDPWNCLKIPNGFGGELPLSGEGIESCGFLVAYPTCKLFRKYYPKEKPFVFSIKASEPQATDSVGRGSESEDASGKPQNPE